MTTYEYTRSLITDAAQGARPRMRAWTAAVGRGWARLRPVSLSLAGLGFLAGAAFHTFGTGAGLLATGLACLLAEYRIRG